MGVDVLGADPTRAASRAVFDALHHSSLPLLQVVESRGGTMYVEVTVAVPNPDAVDVDVVKRELPHGVVEVRAVAGGMRSPHGEALIACATVLVSVDLPD
jgi:uncharacterized protein (TIGR02058 family)